MRATRSTLLLVLLWSGSARAQTPPLDWQAPAGCPDGAWFVADIGRLTGRGLDTLITEGSRLRVALEPSGEVWSMTLRLSTSAEARTVRGRSCASVAQAAVIVAAITLDPSFLLRPEAAAALDQAGLTSELEPADTTVEGPAPPVATDPAPATSEEPRVPAVSVRDTPPVTPPHSPPARSRAVLYSVGAEAGTSVGDLPGLGVSAHVRGSAAVDPWRFHLGAGYWLPREELVRDGAPQGGSFWLVAGHAGACRRILGPLSACLNVEGGALVGEGFGVTDPGEGASLWAAVSAGPDISLPVTKLLAVTASLEALVPWFRHSYVLRGAAPVFSPGVVAGRLHMGLAVKLL